MPGLYQASGDKLLIFLCDAAKLCHEGAALGLIMGNQHANFFYECFLCERQFQFGRYVYDGQNIPSWGINICNTCRLANYDGLDPVQHPRLLQLLNKQRIPLKLNRNCLIDIPKGGAPQK